MKEDPEKVVWMIFTEIFSCRAELVIIISIAMVSFYEITNKVLKKCICTGINSIWFCIKSTIYF